MKSPRRQPAAQTSATFTSRFVLGACVATFLFSAACSRQEAPPPPPPPANTAPVPPPAPPPPAPPAPAAVGAITLGKGVGPDKKVTAPSDSFGPKDTIYASVDTTGVGKGTVLTAKWTFTDKKGKTIPVHEEPLTVDLDGPATNEFHVSKKTPWPKGSYEVEIFLAGTSAGKKAFSVK